MSKVFRRTITLRYYPYDYPYEIITAIRKEIEHENSVDKTEKEPNSYSYLCLPYISEQCCREVYACLRKHDLLSKIRVVFKPGTTLKNTLVRTKMLPTKCTSRSIDTCDLCQQHGRYCYTHCQTKSVVYNLKCTMCSENYVGETGGPFRNRIRNHKLSVVNKTRATAMGVHYLENHPDTSVPDQPFETSLLKSCTDCPDRKIWEAVKIKYHSPAINTQLIKSITKKTQYNTDSWAVF